MPPEMYCYYMLDYTKPKIWNFWNKLSDSIRTESAPQLSASNRILDRETGTRQCNDPLAITQDQKENTLKPVSPSVKFKSPVDSNNSSQLVLSEQPSESLNPSTSSNSLDSQISPEKKSKQKSNWLKKLLNKGYPTEKCGSEHITNGDSSEKCEKKRFWARQRKRKAEIAAWLLSIIDRCHFSCRLVFAYVGQLFESINSSYDYLISMIFFWTVISQF